MFKQIFFVNNLLHIAKISIKKNQNGSRMDLAKDPFSNKGRLWVKNMDPFRV